MNSSNKSTIYKPIQGLFITNQEIGHNAYKINRLKEEFYKAGVNTQTIFNDGTLCSIVNNKVNFHLPKANFIIYLDKDKYLSTLLADTHYYILNRPDFLKLCDDKMMSYTQLVNHDIPIVDTIPGPLVYHNIVDEHTPFLETIAKRLGLPLVVKKVYGSLGEGVFLANNIDELKKIYSNLYRFPLIFQKYICSSKGVSLRVLVIDRKIIGAIKRINDTDFRSNAANSRSEIYHLSENEKIIINKIIELFQIDYAGLDFAFDEDGSILLLEMNSNAFFEQFEKTTGINVASLIVDMVLKKVTNHEK